MARTQWFVAGAVLALFVTSRSAAQSDKPWLFPQQLRPAMEARLQQFIAAQSEGRWDDVSTLLGSYRYGTLAGPMPYTPAHKACLASQMQASPLVEFTFSIQESPFSSAILTTPAGRRWWTLVGDGVISGRSETERRRVSVVAYRDRGTWFFTPQYIDDRAWARAHIRADEIAADQKDRVKLALAPGCPLEIVDVHAFRDPKNVASLRIEFRFRNNSDKPVGAYNFEIKDREHGGSRSTGTGSPRDRLAPGGLSRKWTDHFVMYSYWCQGESKPVIEIQSVTFADGSTWDAPGY